MSILIKNATILTMNDDKQIIENGSILIQDSTIAEIGNNLDEAGVDEVIDAQGMAVMPGLINTHNHTPMSLLRAFSDDLRLMDWLEKKMLPAEGNMTRDDIYWGSKLGMAEMIKSGTTAFADMYIHMDAIAEAVEETGMRASLTRGLVFLEDDGGERMNEALDLIEKWSGAADGRITTMFGPHAPYTCPLDPLKEVVKLAGKMDVPIHIHLAETKEEGEKIQEGYGKTPTEFLAEAGMLDGSHHVLLAHGIHLSDQDIELLKPIKGGIAHNPFSNLKLGCGIAPVVKLLQAGINVGLGTDGPGSATSLDLFKEMKFAAGLQKVEHFDPTVLGAETALQMATVGGARLLNIDQQVGTLEAGKKADMILVDMKKPHLVPYHNVASLLAYGAEGADVDTTIVNGKVLMRNRKLTTMDEEELYQQVHERAARIVEGV